MGNQQSVSENISTTINKSMTDILMESSQSCSQNNNLAQTLTLNNIDSSGTNCRINISDNKQEAVQTPNFTCSQQTQQDNDLMAKLQTKLQQEAESKTSGVPLGSSKAISANVANVVNEIETNVKISNVAKCVQDNSLSQDMVIKNIKSGCPGYCKKGCKDGYTCDMSLCELKISNLGQVATQAAVAKCLSSNSQLNKVINDASTEISQSAKSATEGVQMAASSGVSCIICCIIISIIISVGYSMYA